MSAGNINNINELRGLQQNGGTGGSGNADPIDGDSFRNFLLDNLEKVNQMQSEAHSAVEGLVTGTETDITKVMGAVEKADVAFQTLMAVRGKLIDSYQEVMNIRL